MSHRDPEKYLYDMKSSCDFLIGFTAGKTIEHYKQDRAFRSLDAIRSSFPRHRLPSARLSQYYWFSSRLGARI